MLKTLQEISEKALLLGRNDFSEDIIQTKWLGFNGVSDEEILEAEQKFNLKFPDDYIEFLKISNGFLQSSTISCSFLPIDKINYLKVYDKDVIDNWFEIEELKDVAELLETSILIGGLMEEQYFLLIPPNSTTEKWAYWKFASWIPGEEIYASLQDYFESDLSFLIGQTKDHN